MQKLNVKGVLVMVKALHTCMIARGVRKFESETITIAKQGSFENNIALQNEFFRMINL